MEKEKMLSGQLYDPTDKELTQLRLRARKLTRKYNQTEADNPEEQQKILAELLSANSKLPFFEAPIYFDYGCFTTFGENCMANFHFTVLDCCPITIGDNVFIGPNCTLAAPIHLFDLEYAKPIVIGSDCWIASNVVICGGVTIGEGCVIGAGSVVTRDIPPHSLAVGNPCRVLREITEADLIEK